MRNVISNSEIEFIDKTGSESRYFSIDLGLQDNSLNVYCGLWNPETYGYNSIGYRITRIEIEQLYEFLGEYLGKHNA